MKEQMQEGFFYELMEALENGRSVMMLISSKGFQISDWKPIVEVRDTAHNGMIIQFDGNLELYLDFNYLELEHDEIDQEWIFVPTNCNIELSLRVVID